jgi:hypothetical protein
MAIKSSFKQQCPSCEAMVPIRDPALIGRKIDCPKCKYRFVVEEPADEVEEGDDGPPKKGKGGLTAVTNKKPANGKAAAKPAAKRRGEDEDDDRPAPKPKKDGGSSTILIVGLGLAAVAVVALAVGAFLLFGGDSKPSSDTPRGPSTNVPAPGPAVGEVQQEQPKEVKQDNKPQLGDATNLLPNDSQIVINLPMDRLMTNPSFKRAMLMTPGSFSETAFQRTWGLPPSEVTHVVKGINADKKTVFSVMRLAKAINHDKLVAALKLKAEAPIGDLKYYLLQRPLDALSTFLLKANEPHEKFALHFPDSYTVVAADLAPMQQFLQAKGHPKHLTEAPAEQAQGENAGGGAPNMQGMQGMMMQQMQGGMRPPGGGGPPQGPGGGGGQPPQQGGAQPPQQGGGQPPQQGGGQPNVPPNKMPPMQFNQGGGNPGGGGGGFQPPGGFPPGMMPPGTNRGGSADTEAAPVSSSYLTVEPNLKAVLDQVEKTSQKEGPGVLLSGAVHMSVLSVDDVKKSLAEQPDAPKIPDFILKIGLEQFKNNVKTVGVGVTEFSDSKLAAAVAVATKDAKTAQGYEKDLSPQLPMLAGLTGMNLESKNGGQNNAQNNNMPGMMGPGMMGPGMMGPGMMGPGMMGPGMQQMQQQMQRMQGRQMPPNMPQAPGGGMQPPMMPPGMMQPGMQQPGADGEKKEEKPKDGEYALWTKDQVIALGVSLNLKPAQYTVVTQILGEGFKAYKGIAEMSDNRSRIHELAAAMQEYVKREGHFPRGTVPRAPSPDRVLDWRPDQRLSWMVQLLPYVADGEFKDLPFENDKSWNESGNLFTGSTVVPQFLTPLPANKRYEFLIRYPGLKSMPLAATHFTGMSGVGLDASEYRSDDPATAKLRGIFGYDRETKADEIKDSPTETIVLIQVPTDPKSPWIAGGGSTVRGVLDAPTRECVQPFVSTTYQGKPGTFAIMADFKVRFIPADIDPKTFQAMCTIAGGEKIKDIDTVAPVVPPPDDFQQPELKADQPQAQAQPRPQPAAPPAAEAAAADPRAKAIRTNQLKMIGLAYHSHLDSKRQPPAKVEDLAPFYENDAKVTAALKDGSFVFLWKSSIQNMTAGTSNTVLAYEKETPDKGGLVLMADGSVKTMSAKEFKDAPKAPGK